MAIIIENMFTGRCEAETHSVCNNMRNIPKSECGEKTTFFTLEFSTYTKIVDHFLNLSLFYVSSSAVYACRCFLHAYEESRDSGGINVRPFMCVRT